MNLKYLEGLNGLRFFAALLVVMRHALESSVKIGLWHPITSTVLFERGLAAVDFFFTLSGFLITYLLIQEYNATGRVSLRRFYQRRICRIWPLYFILLAIGFSFFTLLYPHIFHERYFDFGLARGLLFYVFFLPHWMASHYRVGLLLPMWSIGVEEQFYLFWAPFVKLFAHRIVRLIAVFVAVTASFQFLVQAGWLTHEAALFDFLSRLRFHYMAVGSFFAWVLFYHGKRYVNSSLAKRWCQAAIILLLGYHYVIGFPKAWGVPLDLGLAVAYGLLILNVSVLPNRLFNLEWEPLNYLGRISYGIYMYHMLSDYGVRMTYQRLHLSGTESALGFAGYTTAVLVMAVVISHFSYRYIETYFLSFGRKRA